MFTVTCTPLGSCGTLTCVTISKFLAVHTVHFRALSVVYEV